MHSSSSALSRRFSARVIRPPGWHRLAGVKYQVADQMSDLALIRFELIVAGGDLQRQHDFLR